MGILPLTLLWLTPPRPVPPVLRLLVGLRGGGGAGRRHVQRGALDEPALPARPRPPGLHLLLVLVHTERRQRERRAAGRLAGTLPPVAPGAHTPWARTHGPGAPPAEPPVAVASR